MIRRRSDQSEDEMKLSRCTLTKDNRKVILQGMIHGIPEALLIWLKKDLSRQMRNGYRVFHEGIRISDSDEKKAKYSEKELELLKCRKIFDSIKEEAIKSLSLTKQFSGDEGDSNGIEYPDNAINIDIFYVEHIRLLAKLLAQKNIDCKEIINIFEGISHEKVISSVAEVYESLLNGKTTLRELHAEAMTLDFFKIADLVETDYRNEVAAKKIDTVSENKNIDKIYVHYGEGHIGGIADLLVDKYGWELRKEEKIDSLKPRIKKR